MPSDNTAAELTTEELNAIIREIRERVRARHPSGEAGDPRVVLADLLPLVHARDAAESKVAAIGTVNPRRPGPLNGLIQRCKRLIARSLDWYIREQVEFNRASVECMNATIEAITELNRSAERLATLHRELEAESRQTTDHLAESVARTLDSEVRELKDIRTHWHQWRRGWEEKLSTNEIQFLRGLADLRAAYDHRVSQIEANLRSDIHTQHADYLGALDRSTIEIQKKLWADLERVREDYERLIHSELRVVRQRAAAPPSGRTEAQPAVEPAPPAAPGLDYLRFADRFRGSEEYVKRNQQFYVDRFRSCASVLDLGCGRGEFLDVLREAGIPGRGIDLGEEFIAICRQKGLDAEQADLFEYLDGLEDDSLDAVFCAQVVEHLPPERLPDLARLAAAKLRRRGLIAIETPNPECLAIFATHFFLDPTHTRPVPAALMGFHLEEAGFGAVEIHQLSPAVETMPSLAELPEEFRQAFFGGLDYAVLARRL